MSMKLGWSRRSFLSAFGAASGGLFAPTGLERCWDVCQEAEASESLD